MENLIRGSATALTGAPVFPTLVQEAILDYDGQISFPAVPLFFQYKLPELVTRASASKTPMACALVSFKRQASLTAHG